MARECLIIVVFFLCIACMNNLFAANALYIDYTMDKIGYSSNKDADEPDSGTIKDLPSTFIWRWAYNSSYILNSAVGTNSLVYSGELISGTCNRIFIHYTGGVTHYDDDSTRTIPAGWGYVPLAHNPLSISINSDDNAKIIMDFNGLEFNTMKSSL